MAASALSQTGAANKAALLHAADSQRTFGVTHTRLTLSVCCRAQNMFRQAMRSPVIMFHVVPSSMKARYEQLSHAERNPAPYASGRFSPDSLGGSSLSAFDHAPSRMSRHGQEQPDTYPPVSHPAVSAAKPPTGQTHSPQRALTSTPTAGLSKKVGRRLSIQLKKGESRDHAHFTR